MAGGRPKSASLQYLYDKHIGDDPELQAIYEEELVNATLARELYELRKRANLAQTELAKLAKTTASVISRLEDPNYRGHSLSMVVRIADILGKRVQVSLVPKSRPIVKTPARGKVTNKTKPGR